MMDRMGKAKARLQNKAPWKPLRKSGVLFGTVSVREATEGDNGWHPHYHVLCIVRADDDEAAKAVLEPVRRVWVDCLKKEGLGGTLERAFHLATGEAVAKYPNKAVKEIDAGAAWSIAEEMTLGRLKKGRGKTGASPWQILREAHAGDEDAARLWQEYALTMHGKRQQVWSNGLKEAVGLLEVEDEEAAEGEEYTDDPDELLHQFNLTEWKKWRRFRAEVLAAARRGPEAVAALFRDGPRGSDDLGEVIERERPKKGDMLTFEDVEEAWNEDPAREASPPPPNVTGHTRAGWMERGMKETIQEKADRLRKKAEAKRPQIEKRAAEMREEFEGKREHFEEVAKRLSEKAKRFER